MIDVQELKKERPILVTTALVPPILRDKKTQTRRLRGLNEINQSPDDWKLVSFQRSTLHNGQWAAFFSNLVGGMNMVVPCPYGGPGDRLWVRETFQFYFPNTIDESEMVREIWRAKNERRRPEGSVVCYRATDKLPLIISPDGDEIGWTPSIHMPRWASRITLELTDVRVQRLLEITAADVVAEGFQFSSDIEQFKATWKKLNGADSWDENPWVWALTFDRLEAAEAELAKLKGQETDDANS